MRYWASQGAQKPEDKEKFDRELEAPDTKASPSRVSEEVAQDEMSLFRQAMGSR